MAPRLDLQALLVSILGTKNVYFQPPPTMQIEYPCIIYKRDYEVAHFADNSPYKHKNRYQLMIIDKNPDTALPFAIRELPMCKFDRFFTADNLNHYVYNLFF